ncbi:hypothetical protein AB5J55_42485 [Streptomyces sp. R11]|uniref:Uncharacterized protein n=1 Tax=Streptomyces sp. R11 TaxID=3238625 RepID=A0AB39NBM6_9ACTN
MAFGDKAVNGGARPACSRQGLDRGTLVVAGDGIDIPRRRGAHPPHRRRGQGHRQRAESLRESIATLRMPAPVQDVDPLTDIALVLGTAPRMRTPEVLQGLTEGRSIASGCTVVDAEVAADGTSVTLTVDMPDGVLAQRVTTPGAFSAG